MWFYLPKNRTQLHRTRKAFFSDTTFKQNRRVRHAAFPKIREAFLFSLFMLFSLQMGKLALLAIVDLDNLRANIFIAEHLDKPNLPEATYLSRWNPGVMVFISIDKHGNILFEGKAYTDEDLPGAIEDCLTRKPFNVAALIIDQDCEMRHVHRLYKALNKALSKNGFWRITHIAKPSASLKHKWKEKYQKLPFR